LVGWLCGWLALADLLFCSEEGTSFVEALKLAWSGKVTVSVEVKEI